MKGQHKRRIIYIDGTLQGSLITALILLESMMVILALIYLRFRYSILLDEYLYSIHLGSIEDMFMRLLNELVIIIITMSIINFAALVFANALWGQYINHIITCFRLGLKKIQSLDLTGNSFNLTPRHEVLDRLEAWRASEEKRCRDLVECLSRFESYNIDNKNERIQQVKHAQSLLPSDNSQ